MPQACISWPWVLYYGGQCYSRGRPELELKMPAIDGYVVSLPSNSLRGAGVIWDPRS